MKSTSESRCTECAVLGTVERTTRNSLWVFRTIAVRGQSREHPDVPQRKAVTRLALALPEATAASHRQVNLTSLLSKRRCGGHCKRHVATAFCQQAGFTGSYRHLCQTGGLGIEESSAETLTLLTGFTRS
jgi:hypothetical protein